MATTALEHAYAEFQSHGFALVDGIFDAATAESFTALQAEIAGEWRAAADAGRMGLDRERGLPSPHPEHAAHKLIALEVLRRGGEPLLRAVEGRIGALTGIPAHAGENLLLQARARGHPGVVTSSAPS